ncbi:MAG: hypothetical protein ACXACB_10295, partial [Promethearchaeota archaeon]
MIVILSYFHTKIGTEIYYSFPKTQLASETSERLFDIMTQQNEEEFFTQSFEDLKFLNYYFQIPSDWARGLKEMVMLSIIIYQDISMEVEEIISSLCKKFSGKMQSTIGMFRGFYIKEVNNYEDNEKESIKKNENLIKESVRDLYWEVFEETRRKKEEEKISSLLNDRYILESLEEMSVELEAICKEISKREENLGVNSEINNSITNINKIIDDLYGGFIEKMSFVDLETEDDVLSMDDETDMDSSQRKKELLRI